MSEKIRKEKNWELRSDAPSAADEAEISRISSELGLSYIMSRLLWGRGFRTPEAARTFLSMGDALIYDPFLLPGMLSEIPATSALSYRGDKA